MFHASKAQMKLLSPQIRDTVLKGVVRRDGTANTGKAVEKMTESAMPGAI